MEETLGKRIVAHRKRLGLTQDQLAEKMGVTAQAVSKWENDQSCPDISALPQLADLFDITVDALLGRENTEEPKAEEPAQEEPENAPVFEASVVNEDEEKEKPHFEMSFSSGKKSRLGYIGLAVWVIAVGGLYLANLLCSWGLSFWELLWPTSLISLGLFHLLPKFSFLSLGCLLVGGYAMASYFLPLPEDLDSRVIWAVLIVLLGISLLADALRKKKRSRHFIPEHIKGDGKFSKSLDMEETSFDYDVSFGTDRAYIDLPLMQKGDIDASFGDFTVDLRGVERVTEGCRLDVDASFGELTLLVPRRFKVDLKQDTSLAGISVNGHPFEPPTGTIYIEADVSFGSLVIEYV